MLLWRTLARFVVLTQGVWVHKPVHALQGENQYDNFSLVTVIILFQSSILVDIHGKMLDWLDCVSEIILILFYAFYFCSQQLYWTSFFVPTFFCLFFSFLCHLLKSYLLSFWLLFFSLPLFLLPFLKYLLCTYHVLGQGLCCVLHNSGKKPVVLLTDCVVYWKNDIIHVNTQRNLYWITLVTNNEKRRMLSRRIMGYLSYTRW